MAASAQHCRSCQDCLHMNTKSLTKDRMVDHPFLGYSLQAALYVMLMWSLLSPRPANLSNPTTVVQDLEIKLENFIQVWYLLVCPGQFPPWSSTDESGQKDQRI